MSGNVSKYCKSGYSISYDESVADAYQPIIYDPYQYGSGYNPALYFRIVESSTAKCIQYFYYWDKQDCEKDYVISEPNTVGSIVGIIFAISEYIVASILGIYFNQIFLVPLWLQFLISFFVGLFVGIKIHNSINDNKVFQRIAGFIVGRFFTHKYDFEPILIFLENSDITKIAISGRGDLDSEPHRNDIFVNQNYHNVGESFFSLQGPLYVKGNEVPQASPQSVIFKEFDDSKLMYAPDDINKHHPKFAIVTCYHAFTGEERYYDEKVFNGEKKMLNFTLKKLTDNVLDDWYNQKGFGHEVSDPFTFPYIRFAGEVNKGRPAILALLEALSMIMKGLIAIKNFITSFGKKTARRNYA